jgi:hypothetical protein
VLKAAWGKQAIAAMGNHPWERKVWTSQEKIPVKDWGPKGYGKCNRKYSARVKSGQAEKC